MKNKLRLSFTLLNYWDSNDLENMLAYYFKTGETTVRPGMEFGKQMDDKNVKNILDQNKFIVEFGGDKLNQPVPHLKLEADYDDKIEVVGELDAYDQPTIYEFKTGVSMDSGDYTNSAQLPFYFWLLKKQGLPAERAIIIHYNPQTRITDRTILWNSNEMFHKFSQIVELKGRMIYDYFEKEGLL
jgi:hypothetical protein